jgi:hypothetical protein
VINSIAAETGKGVSVGNVEQLEGRHKSASGNALRAAAITFGIGRLIGVSVGGYIKKIPDE